MQKTFLVVFLMAALVSFACGVEALPDTTPPAAVSVSPANGATGVSRTSPKISAAFSEAMKSETINTSTFRAASPAEQYQAQ